jgi:hypothetical protein
MNKFILALPLSCAVLFGQCSSLMSPTTLNFTAAPNLLVSWGPTSLPQTVSITPGVGNPWSASGGGCCASGSTLTGATSGTGAATYYIALQGGAVEHAPATGFTDIYNFTINGTACTLNINYTVAARVIPTIENAKGIADGSLPGTSSTGGQIYANDLVPASLYNALPGGSRSVPAPGSSYTDAVFGTVRTNCTPDTGSYTTLYGSISAVNLNDTALFFLSPGGTPTLEKVPCDGVLHTPAFSPSTENLSWSRVTANVGYYISGPSIYKPVFNLSTFTITSNPLIFTPPCSGGSCASLTISNGATDDVSNVDSNGHEWWSFNTNMNATGDTNHPLACLIDLTAVAAYCRDMSIDFPVVIGNLPNFTVGSKGCDPRTSKRYLMTGVGTAPPHYGPLYSIPCGGGTMAFEHMMPIGPGNNIPFGGAMTYLTSACDARAQTADACMFTGAHGALGEDVNHHQFWIADGGTNNPSLASAQIVDLALSDATSGVAVQNGGGFDAGLPFDGTTVGDIGPGCMDGGWCSVDETPSISSGSGVGYDIAGFNVSAAATVGSTIQLTIAAAFGGATLATGNAAVVSEVVGCTNANSASQPGGFWPGSSITVSGSMLTISGVICNAPYTSGGIVYNSSARLSTQSFRHEQFMMRVVGNQIFDVRRLGSSLGVGVCCESNDDYYQHQQLNLSPSKKWAVYNTNFGIPGLNHVMMLQTGIITNSQSAQPVSALSIQAIH